MVKINTASFAMITPLSPEAIRYPYHHVYNFLQNIAYVAVCRIVFAAKPRTSCCIGRVAAAESGSRTVSTVTHLKLVFLCRRERCQHGQWRFSSILDLWRTGSNQSTLVTGSGQHPIGEWLHDSFPEQWRLSRCLKCISC